MRRNGLVQILFTDTPKGTDYKPGTWSWVSASQGQEYIEEGYGREWKPDKVKEKEEVKEYPFHTGGGWYELSTGEKVQGKEEAEFQEESYD